MAVKKRSEKTFTTYVIENCIYINNLDKRRIDLADVFILNKKLLFSMYV